MLLLMKVYLQRQFETVDQLKLFLLIEWNELSFFFIINSIDEWKNVSRLLSRTTGAHIEHILNYLTNVTL